MADLAGRVRLLEKRLSFIMDNMRMKAAIGTGLLDAEGKPQVRIFEGSLSELFAASRLADALLTESDADPSILGETVNG